MTCRWHVRAATDQGASRAANRIPPLPPTKNPCVRVEPAHGFFSFVFRSDNSYNITLFILFDLHSYVEVDMPKFLVLKISIL